MGKFTLSSANCGVLECVVSHKPSSKNSVACCLLPPPTTKMAAAAAYTPLDHSGKSDEAVRARAIKVMNFSFVMLQEGEEVLNTDSTFVVRQLTRGTQLALISELEQALYQKYHLWGGTYNKRTLKKFAAIFPEGYLPKPANLEHYDGFDDNGFPIPEKAVPKAEDPK